MTEKRSIYINSSAERHFFLFVSALAMIAISIYMTRHYYDVHYAEGLISKSVCEINSFFSCDKATQSALSNIFGVPLAVYGILMGILILLGYLFQSTEYEGTLHYILILNFGGCLLLFLYSLAGLSGLCPFCTLYYVFSGIAALLFYKTSQFRSIHLKPFTMISLLFIVTSAIFFWITSSKNKDRDKNNSMIIKQFYSEKNLGYPEKESPFKLAKVKKGAAPIRLSIFSDFECPACKRLSELMKSIEERYEGKIDIHYYFFPLDPTCNSSVGRQIHRYACKAAYVATCLPEKFHKIHDEIFENQERLSDDWLEELAKRENVLECIHDPKTQNSVADIIKLAAPFNIRSTPTTLVNGVKIEGLIDIRYWYIILDSLIEKK